MAECSDFSSRSDPFGSYTKSPLIACDQSHKGNSHNVLASESQENQKAESTLIIAKHFFFFFEGEWYFWENFIITKSDIFLSFMLHTKGKSQP